MVRTLHLLAVLCLVVNAVPAHSQEKKKDDKKQETAETVSLKGTYEVKRILPGGKVQEGVAVFTKAAEGWNIVWTFNNGEVVRGIGIRVDDRVAASFLSDPKEKGADKILGTASYKITLKDGKPQLDGVWFSTQTLNIKLDDKASFLK